jgi:hypothetical protein
MKRLFTSRIWISVVTLALLVAAALAVYTVFRFNWQYGLPTHDKTLIVNTVIAACALALVGWGVIVALAAYIAATGSPDLRPEITFSFSLVNQPVFKAQVEFSEWGQGLPTESFKQMDGRIVIRNKSKYAAHNPGVLIELDGLGIYPPPELGEWRIISSTNMVGITAIQLDGGADYIIHGNWHRTLPPLDFRGLAGYGHQPYFLSVSVAADGFGPRKWRIPVRILGPVSMTSI